jgi:hypothetical protein
VKLQKTSRNEEKMKKYGLILLVFVLLAGTVMVTEKEVSLRYKSEIIRLKSEAAIYRVESENYAKVLRSIRESAATVMPIEKATP